MRRKYFVIAVLMLSILCGCRSFVKNEEEQEMTKEFFLEQECAYGDSAFTIDKAELDSNIFRLYLSGLNGTEFQDNIYLVATEENDKCAPSDIHYDTDSTGILTFRFEDEIVPEQILSLRIRPMDSSVEEPYTEFALSL